MSNLIRCTLEPYSAPVIEVIALAIGEKVLVSSDPLPKDSSINPILDGSDFGTI